MCLIEVLPRDPGVDLAQVPCIRSFDTDIASVLGGAFRPRGMEIY